MSPSGVTGTADGSSSAPAPPRSFRQLPVVGEPPASLVNRAPALLLSAAILIFIAGMMYGTRELGFWQDEWSFVTTRLSWDPGVFLRAFNQQPMILPVLVYKLLLPTAGLSQTWPYRLVLLCIHGLCVTLLWLLARRRLGGWLALIPALLLLGLGAAWEDLTLALQINYLGSVAAGLGALLFLDRDDLTGDRIACLLLTVAWLWSSVGVTLILGVAGGLLWTRSFRRWWVVIVPLALYGLWYVGYGSSTAMLSNLSELPQYFWAASGAVFGGLLGVNETAGKLVFVVSMLVLAWRLVRGGPVGLLAATGIVGYVAFWVITDLNRAQYHQPDASRYIYPAAVLVLLAAIGLSRWRPVTPAAWLVIACAMALILYSGSNQLHTAVYNRDAVDTEVKAELGALQIAGPMVSGDVLPDQHHAPVLTVRGYRIAERRLHSSAGFTASQILGVIETYREVIDQKLISWERIAVRPVAIVPTQNGALPVLEQETGATVAADASCLLLRSLRPGSSVELRVDPGRELVLRAIGAPGRYDVMLRRFGSDFVPPGQQIPATRASELLALPRDGTALPWHVQIASAQPLRVCSATPANQ